MLVLLIVPGCVTPTRRHHLNPNHRWGQESFRAHIEVRRMKLQRGRGEKVEGEKGGGGGEGS